MPDVRPDLNGLRVKLPNRDEIFLIDRGYRRLIPTRATYNNLFGDLNEANDIVIDIDIDEISLGDSITSGAILVRAEGTNPVYLIDQGKKRCILSQEAKKKYFSKGRVDVLPPIVIDAIPDGSNIS